MTALSVGSVIRGIFVAMRHQIDEHFVAIAAAAFGLATVCLAIAPDLAVATVAAALLGRDTVPSWL